LEAANALGIRLVSEIARLPAARWGGLKQAWHVQRLVQAFVGRDRCIINLDALCLRSREGRHLPPFIQMPSVRR